MVKKIFSKCCQTSNQIAMGSTLGATNYISLLQGAASLKRLGITDLERQQVQVCSCEASLLTKPGSPNFFVRGPYKVIQNMSRAGRLTQCDCCGICYILRNQKTFPKYCILFFHHWQNGFIDKMASRAGWNGFAGRIWPVGRSLETPGLNHRCLGLTVRGTVCWRLDSYKRQVIYWQRPEVTRAISKAKTVAW